MFQKGVGLTVKKLRTLRNTALKTANANSAYSTGLIIGSIFASEIWGGGAYFREGYISEFYGITCPRMALDEFYV